MGRLNDFITGGPAFQRSFRLFAEMNYDTDLLFAHHVGGRTREIAISHAEYDGINGFTHLLERAGSLRADSFPVVPVRKRRFAPIVWLNRLFQYLRVLWQFSRKSQQWRAGTGTVPGFVTVWRFFSVAETEKLRQDARREGASLNSLLLYYLNATVRDHLEPSLDPATWIIPVSLYPDFASARKSGLKTSIMEVSLLDIDTPAMVHERVKREVERESYWGTIVGALVNHFRSDEVNRKALAKTIARRKRVGTFSNIGRWRGSESSSEEAWGVVPPVHPGQPLGAAALEFNGKLGLGMKLDPSLGIDETGANGLIDRWVELLRQEEI